MLVIEAVANTLLVLLVIGFSMVGFNKLLGRVVENSYAKIARVEAARLDEQLRILQERNEL